MANWLGRSVSPDDHRHLLAPVARQRRTHPDGDRRRWIGPWSALSTATPVWRPRGDCRFRVVAVCWPSRVMDVSLPWPGRLPPTPIRVRIGVGGSRADYKPGFVPAARAVAIYLRRRSPGASSDRYPRARRATLSPAGLGCPAGPLAGNALLFGLAPGGVCLAGRSPGRRWALTPPFHPYRPLPEEEPAVSFLWHFPSSHPDWGLPSALLYGARTFLSDSRRKQSGHPSASTRGDLTTSASVRRSPDWPEHRPPGSSPAARG